MSKQQPAPQMAPPVIAVEQDPLPFIGFGQTVRLNKTELPIIFGNIDFFGVAENESVITDLSEVKAGFEALIPGSYEAFRQVFCQTAQIPNAKDAVFQQRLQNALVDAVAIEKAEEGKMPAAKFPVDTNALSYALASLAVTHFNVQNQSKDWTGMYEAVIAAAFPEIDEPETKATESVTTETTEPASTKIDAKAATETPIEPVKLVTVESREDVISNLQALQKLVTAGLEMNAKLATVVGAAVATLQGLSELQQISQTQLQSVNELLQQIPAETTK